MGFAPMKCDKFFQEWIRSKPKVSLVWGKGGKVHKSSGISTGGPN